MADIRGASLAAHAGARDVKENGAAFFAAHAEGQAVATAHVTQHAFGSAYYALRAVVAADPGHADVKAAEERNWQSLRPARKSQAGNNEQNSYPEARQQNRCQSSKGWGLLNSAAGPVPPVPAPRVDCQRSERRRVIAEGLADLIRAELAMPERGLPPPAFAQHGGSRLRRAGEAGRPYIGQRGANGQRWLDVQHGVTHAGAKIICRVDGGQIAPSSPGMPGGVPVQYFASFGSFTARDEIQSIVLKAGQEASIMGEIPDLVHLDKRHDAALAFKLTTTGTIKLTVTINDNPLLDQQFESPEPDSVMRVWHEIIHGRNLKRRNNRLNITASNGTGQVELSDFVLSYHAKTP